MFQTLCEQLTLMTSKLGPLLRRRESHGHVVTVHDFLDVFSIPADNLAMEGFRKVERGLGRQFFLQDAKRDGNIGDALTADVEGEEAVA